MGCKYTSEPPTALGMGFKWSFLLIDARNLRKVRSSRCGMFTPHGDCLAHWISINRDGYAIIYVMRKFPTKFQLGIMWSTPIRTLAKIRSYACLQGLGFALWPQCGHSAWGMRTRNDAGASQRGNLNQSRYVTHRRASCRYFAHRRTQQRMNRLCGRAWQKRIYPGKSRKLPVNWLKCLCFICLTITKEQTIVRAGGPG